jgi:hypothetical protein
MAGDSRNVAMSEIAAEIESDRQTLRELMAAMDLTPSLLKTVTGWLGEKAARIKLGGVSRRSSLGLLELEVLITGVSGKLQLWRALSAVDAADSRLGRFDFRRLAQRAEEQRRRLEELHERAAPKALGGAHR